MALLAAYQLLLARFTGQEDIAIGMPIANRTRKESERLIGFFVNTLVVRTVVASGVSFREILGRVREAAVGAYANQALPFDKVVEQLHPERNTGSTPLFRAMFALQNSPQFALQLEGTTLRQERLEIESARFDLTLSLFESQDSLRASLIYSRDLFDRGTIEQLLATFGLLLAGAVENPDKPIGLLPLVSAFDEQHQLLAWNTSGTQYPDNECFHQLFERRVQLNEDSVAACYEGEHLTCGTLNLRANQLANYLQKHGIGPEKIVAVCMERSPEMLVAILGILKAGGAYLPIDSELPTQRLAYMLKDSAAELVLTDRRQASQVLRLGTPSIRIDDDWSVISHESPLPPAVGATAEHLAYIVYTSGSTGQPKGSLISHRSLVNYLFWVNETLLGGSACHLPAVTKLSFDASLKQLLAPLLRGAEVWLVPNDIARQPGKLWKN